MRILAPSSLKPLAELIADKPMNLLDIFGRRREAGADRPDRLVGHHEIGGRRAIRQRAARAGRRQPSSVCPASRWAWVSPMQTIGSEPGPPRRFGLLPHQRIGFAVVGAALGMADDDGGGAGIRQHFGGNIAGMGAGRLGMAILRADREAVLNRAPFGEGGNQRRRRADQQIGLCRDSSARRRSSASSSASRGLQAVHLPVAGNQRPMARVMGDFESRTSAGIVPAACASRRIGRGQSPAPARRLADR